MRRVTHIVIFLLGATILPAANPKPNILWISCEDTSPDLGCYGDRYATTPNLDQFAAEGCRFDRAYVTFPVCAPSRPSIITGVHPGTLGTHQMRTGMKNYEAVPPPEVKCFTEYLRAAGYDCSNQSKTDYQFDAPFTAWNARKGDWRNPDRQAGQPFFCVINLGCSHESQCWDITKLAHDPGKAPLPAFYPDTPKVRSGVARDYDQVTEMDRQAGTIQRRLEADGLASNTIVFFWGDHGRGLPRYKRWPYETGLRVPLLVRWPGQLKPGSVNDELVCLTMHRMFCLEINPKQTEPHPRESHSLLFQNGAGDSPRSCRGADGRGPAQYHRHSGRRSRLRRPEPLRRLGQDPED
jgi:uncharacterized sulfatase